MRISDWSSDVCSSDLGIGHTKTGVGSMSAPTTMRVFITLTIRKRNGRPKIVPPADMEPDTGGGIDPHVLKAIAKAWSWRRKLESGAAEQIKDIAEDEGVADRYVGGLLRLDVLAHT